MTKRYYPLVLGEEEYRLRLTMAGQKALKEQWGEDILPFFFSAATDGEKLCALLGQCLTWSDSGNPITDGAALYDRMVDEGWQGQECFAGLIFELAQVSGLLDAQQAQTLNAAVRKAYRQVFEQLEQP